jgi:hypothetical protein
MASFEHIFSQAQDNDVDKKSDEQKQANNADKVDTKLTKQYQALMYDEKKREKAKEEKKKTKYSVTTNFMSSNDVEEMLKQEITDTMHKRSWKCLDMCLRWRLILDYLESKGVNANKEKTVLTELKLWLRQGALHNISYDQKEQRIVSLDVKVGGHSL